MANDFNPEVAWYLQEASGLLGETSNYIAESHGDVIPTSSDPYHKAFRRRCQHVAMTRKCDTAWSLMGSYSRLILRSRYQVRSYWPPHTVAQLSSDLVGIALATAEDRELLIQACEVGKKTPKELKGLYKALIAQARTRAMEDSIHAHDQWASIWRSLPKVKSASQLRTERFQEDLGL